MKVLVAMSGGVDSSVAAAELKDAGHDVVGVTKMNNKMRNTKAIILLLNEQILKSNYRSQQI